MITEQMQIGIRVAMARRNINIDKAARKAGLTPSTIHRFLNGDTNIRLSTLDTFCRDGLGYEFMTVLKMGRQP